MKLQRYAEKIFSEVKITRDILYATLPGYDEDHTPTELLLDVYEPDNDMEENRRAMIFVHGGGFIGGTRNSGYPSIMCDTLAQYGYVCFNIDYRLFIKESRPSYAECAPYTALDIEAARQFIVSRADEFGIDPTNISIGGGSAGAMASIDACKIYPDYKSFICLWGTYVDAQVSKKYVPTFLVHGTGDQIVPYEYSRAFLARLESRGIACELLTLPDAPHTAIKWLPDYEEPMIRFMNSVM